MVGDILRYYAGWVKAGKLDQKAATEKVICEMPAVPPEDIRSAVASEAPAWCPDTSLDRSLLERTLGELEFQSVLANGFRLDDVIASLGTL